MATLDFRNNILFEGETMDYTLEQTGVNLKGATITLYKAPYDLFVQGDEDATEEQFILLGVISENEFTLDDLMETIEENVGQACDPERFELLEEDLLVTGDVDDIYDLFNKYSEEFEDDENYIPEIGC